MQHEVSFGCYPLTCQVSSPWLNNTLLPLVSSLYQITDRYYKLGSSVDITCQVAISYLNTLPSSPSSSSSMMSNDVNVNRFQPSTTTSTTTTVFPFIDTNLIRRNFQPSIPYTGNHIIKWKKDGRDLPKDIKINLRLVQPFFHTISKFPQSFHFFVLERIRM